MKKRQRKTKTKTKSKKSSPSKKKALSKKKSRRKVPARAGELALAAATLGETTGATEDPIGACYWVDASGQNRCKVTTQSECDNITGSTFRPNKNCAGGVG